MKVADLVVGGALSLLMAANAMAEPAADEAAVHRERGRALAAAATTTAEMAAACAEFEASIVRERDAGTFQRLAVCYQKISRLGAAWHAFVAARDAARARGLARLESYADANLAALHPARLIIIAPAAHRDGLDITIDDRVVAASAVGIEALPAPDERGEVGIPVDAGQHWIRASTRDAAPFERVVEAIDGVSTMVLVELTADRLAPRSAPHPQPRGVPRSRRRAVGRIVLGASGALAITGVGFGLAAWSEDRAADAACPAHVGCAPDVIATNQRAGRFALVADLTITGAVVGAATGTYLMITRPSRDHASAGLAVAAHF